ncbi:MAG TPA: c-type cytochrome biogenesis protein CcmI [Rhizomicrobium sp.]|nr:c-type cytochrome biogenesis protein CcmI [Rhizomicrobium sp.]
MTVMIAVAASALTIPLVRRHDIRSRLDTLEVLKGQLAELEGQIASGAMRDAEADGLRAEIKRRALVEARGDDPAPRPISTRKLPWLSVGVASFLAIGATVLYAVLGNPGQPSVAAVPAGRNTQRPAQANPHAVSDVASLIGQLEAKMRAHPGDPEGWRMLGWSYMQTGRPGDAATAYARAAALDPKNSDYVSAEGEALTQAAGGQVTPPALSAFRRALALNKGDPRAQYFLATFKDQQGDHAGAIADWITLLKSAPAGAAWTPQVREVIERTAQQYNVDIAGRLPASPPMGEAPSAEANNNAMPSPSPDQIAGANRMSEADRQAMIRGMVDRLAAELKENPHNEEGWVRLMRARMVLRDSGAAAAAYRDARKAFAGQPAEIAALQAAARDLHIPGA